MIVTVYDLNGERLPVFEDVDRVFCTNRESFKDPAGLDSLKHGERVLLLNVNGYSAALVSDD